MPSTSLDPSSFEALTFDCYGTLVDWESGILEAMGRVLAAHGCDVGDEERALARFAHHESRIEAAGWRPYREVLEEVIRSVGSEYGIDATPEEAAAFAASVGRWPVFPDTRRVLPALSERYRLAIVSNVDDDLFEGTAVALGVEFDVVVTAQQTRSYKPHPGHFHRVLEELDLPRSRVLHVAQSLFHDIAPARALGFHTVWVNRRAGRGGSGATPPAEAVPDLEVPDLATLAHVMA
ncbi:MAG: haloacid dehalogenase type II [Gemmatimonadota bacterium]